MEKIASFQTRKMMVFALLMSVVLLGSASGCGGTAPLSEDDPAFQEALQTALAGTLTAQALDVQRTKGAQAAVDPTETTEPSPTVTPEPTQTPTQAPTSTEDLTDTSADGAGVPTATVQVFSSDVSGLAVQVSVDTNCRIGPGKDYAYAGAILVGEQATVVGTDPQRQYWYITNPDVEGGYCWIWGRYASVSGNTASLPVFTPRPSPTTNVNFSTDYYQVESCGGAWQIEFVIKNTGSMDLQSLEISVYDTVTGKNSGTLGYNSFVSKSGCTTTSTKERLKPGASGYAISPGLPDDPTGHLLSATMTICNVDGRSGPCRTREFYFTP